MRSTLFMVSTMCTGMRIVRPGRRCAGDGLADPPRGVGGELEALGVVELLDRADQAEVALLDEVEQRHATTHVALGDRHDESKVRLGELLLGELAVTRDRETVDAPRFVDRVGLEIDGSARQAARAVQQHEHPRHELGRVELLLRERTGFDALARRTS